MLVEVTELALSWQHEDSVFRSVWRLGVLGEWRLCPVVDFGLPRVCVLFRQPEPSGKPVRPNESSVGLRTWQVRSYRSEAVADPDQS